jgi:hypothetical protein
MHLAHALLRIGEHYWKPMAEANGFSHVMTEFKLKKWDHVDRFLLLLLDAGFQWLKCM